MRTPPAVLGVMAMWALSCSTPHPTSQPGANTPAMPSTPPAWVLTPDQFGPVRIGGTVADLNAALGDQSKPPGGLNGTCSYLRPAAFPQGARAMVEGDAVVRIDVERPGILTPERAGVGDTEARVLTLYGTRASVSPHKYTAPEGHYVTVTHPGDSTRLTIFETDGHVVLRYRAGIRPAVEYVEGCS